MGLIETIGAVIAAIIGLALAAVRIRSTARRQGKEEAEEAARRLDHENAAAIRNRARNAKRVQPEDDTRGWRP